MTTAGEFLEDVEGARSINGHLENVIVGGGADVVLLPAQTFDVFLS